MATPPRERERERNGLRLPPMRVSSSGRQEVKHAGKQVDSNPASMDNINRRVPFINSGWCPHPAGRCHRSSLKAVAELICRKRRKTPSWRVPSIDVTTINSRGCQDRSGASWRLPSIDVTTIDSRGCKDMPGASWRLPSIDVTTIDSRGCKGMLGERWRFSPIDGVGIDSRGFKEGEGEKERGREGERERKFGDPLHRCHWELMRMKNEGLDK